MSYQFPMERVLYNLHHQVCSFMLRKTSGKFRNLVERLLLVFAVCGFGALLMAHLSFVYRGDGGGDLDVIGGGGGGGGKNNSSSNIPLMCLPNIPGFTNDFDIIHLSLLTDGGGGEETGRGGRRIAGSYAFSLSTGSTHQDRDDAHRHCIPAAKARGSSNMNQEHEGRSCLAPADAMKDNSIGAGEAPLFSYSQVKGYLMLPSEIVEERRLKVLRVAVSRSDTRCFGEPFLRNLIFRVIRGSDTVMLNWLLALGDGSGYAYNPRTDTMIDLNDYNNGGGGSEIKNGKKTKRGEMEAVETQNSKDGSDDPPQSSSSPSKMSTLAQWYRQIISKLALVLKTGFLFFITTTLVSFTLRETQERMLDFTHQLRAHVRSHRPVAQLVTTHLVENLVFVPIVGMMFFLNEFYRGDKILAFTVVSLVWICEVFSVVSLRSKEGIHFFPRIFFLLFSLFHFYAFSFPFGFSYTALASTICFMTHSMLFFWHRYELPAVAHGLVTREHPRMGIPATNTSPNSIPSLELSRNSGDPFRPLQIGVPVVNLPPRQQVVRQASLSSSAGRMSRPTSSGGLFPHRGGSEENDGDESSSYMYFLEGEVVMHRRPHSPYTPGSTAGSQIHSTGSMDDNSGSHGHGHNNHSTRNGRIPERIVLAAPAAPSIPQQQQLHASAPLQGTMRLGGSIGNAATVASRPIGDEAETSALHANQQQPNETPRTDNLSSTAQQEESASRVRAAPIFPSLGSKKRR